MQAECFHCSYIFVITYEGGDYQCPNCRTICTFAAFKKNGGKGLLYRASLTFGVSVVLGVSFALDWVGVALVLGLVLWTIVGALGKIKGPVQVLMPKRERSTKNTMVVALAGCLIAFLGLQGMDAEEARKVDEKAKLEAQEKLKSQNDAQLQALDVAEKNISDLEKRLRGKLALRMNELESVDLETADGLFSTTVDELTELKLTAGRQSRSELEGKLSNLFRLIRVDFFYASRIQFAKRRQEEASSLYKNANYEGARAILYSLSKEVASLKGMAGTQTVDFTTLSSNIEKDLNRAVRGKELPDAVTYFQNWKGKRKDFRGNISSVIAPKDRDAIVLKLGLALNYLRYLESVSDEEVHLAPEKYRSPRFISQRRLEIGELEVAANESLIFTKKNYRKKPEAARFNYIRGIFESAGSDTDVGRTIATLHIHLRTAGVEEDGVAGIDHCTRGILRRDKTVTSNLRTMLSRRSMREVSSGSLDGMAMICAVSFAKLAGI